MNSGSNQPLRPALGTAAGMALVISLAAAGIQAAEPVQSEWIFPGPNGKLMYQTTPTGDKIVDFSHAGYMGGGVALPVVPVRRTLEPSGSDDETAAIQRMLDEVAAMKLENGFRGAVLLGPGTFSCSETLSIEQTIEKGL